MSLAPNVKDYDSGGSMKPINSRRSKGPVNCIVKKLEHMHGRGSRRRRSSNRTEKEYLDDLTIDQAMADHDSQASS
jgi:hypothetical protein